MKSDRKSDMEWNGKKVLVAGCGKSGIAAMKLLEHTGADTILYDGNEQLEEAAVREKLTQSGMEGAQQARIVLGVLPQEIEQTLDYLVLSPGIPTDLDWIIRLGEKGVRILGEIELAYLFEKGKVLAITGTNGKTTTTTLLGEIMKAAGQKVFVVGNIGNPYTEEVLRTDQNSTTVAEISSFQLETVHTFCPQVSAILNITPDHLNRHHTMENYVAAKQAIAALQTKEQQCILNYEDSYTREFAKTCSAAPVFFASSHTLRDGFFYRGDCIWKAVDGQEQRLMDIHEMKLLGMHNVENVMAAIAMADAYGVAMDTILDAVRAFQAVEHRIEYVATKGGVDYYNDSKGTNPDAAIKGIQAMVKPTYLIGGGYDKQSAYDEWIESFGGRVKKLVLLGQTREKIAACAAEHGFTDYLFVDTLEEAVAYCSQNAEAGEAVLLSPACASWGMFPNYEVRGKMFKELVHQL